MGKRIVLALGGNALGKDLPGQMAAVKKTAPAIADLIEEGHEIVIVHGNGPQVGMIQNAMTELVRSDPERYIPCPLSVCVAMSQGYIGYDLQNALREELLNRGIGQGVATVLTQVEVDPEDPAFLRPSKPIGAFMTEAEAQRMVEERSYTVMEDAGRGWRRVVASPRAQNIVEIDTIRSLVETNHTVVACGGGGIPVFRTQGNHLKGAAAVIDKDFAAARLAEQLDADCLIILTAVEKVAIHFNRPDVRWLDTLSVEEAQAYIAQKEFAAGSMLPKVEACLRFVQSAPGREALITQLERARDGFAGKTGTRFVCPGPRTPDHSVALHRERGASAQDRQRREED
jgi:carbamate kinase